MVVSEKVELAANWPSTGEIIFHNVSIRYSDSADPVVRNLNLHIRPGEKVSLDTCLYCYSC